MQTNENGDSSKNSEKSELHDSPVESPLYRFSRMLVEARVKSGYSLEQVAVMSKISIHSLSALESGDLVMLPGTVFGRGFIRTLCTLYQVNSQDFLGAFALALGEKKIEEPRLMGTEAMRQRCLTLTDGWFMKLLARCGVSSSFSSGVWSMTIGLIALAAGGIYLGLIMFEKF
jgi:cytoskeletal protein RodZ